MDLGEEGEQEIGNAGVIEADRVSQAGDLPTGEGGDVSINAFIQDAVYTIIVRKKKCCIVMFPTRVTSFRSIHSTDTDIRLG